jgi:hypothetical protein
MFRYQNINSSAPFFRVASGGAQAHPFVGFFQDPRPAEPHPVNPDEPADATRWRVAAITVQVDHHLPPEELGVINVAITADQGPQNGTRIRVDEVWAVIGATAAPPRAHAHRIELLDAPVRVVSRLDLVETTTFGETNLARLPGLGRAPRGSVGALLSLEGVTRPMGAPLRPGLAGAVRTTVITPWVRSPSSRVNRLSILVDRSTQDRQFLMRGMSFTDGILFAAGDATPTTYRVDVLGWVLPS